MTAVKRDARAKGKPRGRPFTGKGDPRNGPGAPKRGQSWAEIIKEIGELTPDEARAMSQKIFSQIQLGNEITIKQAVVLRVYAALMFDPQPGLLNAFMERAEGKVAQPITQMTDEQLRNFIAAEIGVDIPGDHGGEAARDSVEYAASNRADIAAQSGAMDQ